MIHRIFVLAVFTIMLSPGSRAGEPKLAAVSFEQYVAQAENEIRAEETSPNSFLSIPASARLAIEAQLREGQILINKWDDSPINISDGLIHHWLGLAFIPGTTIADVLRILQTYDHLNRYYAPEVVSSKLLTRNGNDFRIALRLREHKVITIILDTEYDVHYGQLDADHQYSVSRSTRVSEIADAGKQGEHALAPEEDHGFLRHLNTYWRFVRVSDGVFVQCEAISKTRDIPAGLAWLVTPFVQSVPKDSLRFTLTATREAVLQHRERN